MKCAILVEVGDENKGEIRRKDIGRYRERYKNL